MIENLFLNEVLDYNRINNGSNIVNNSNNKNFWNTLGNDIGNSFFSNQNTNLLTGILGMYGRGFSLKAGLIGIGLNLVLNIANSVINAFTKKNENTGVENSLLSKTITKNKELELKNENLEKKVEELSKEYIKHTDLLEKYLVKQNETISMLKKNNDGLSM